MHPELQDGSHPAAADYYILFFSLYFDDPPDPPDLPTYLVFFPARLARARMDGRAGASSLQICRPEGVNELAEVGPIDCFVKDIDGCFPNMPKDKIRFALRDILEKLRKNHSFEAVAIPSKDTLPCSWVTMKTKRVAKTKKVIPFDDLLGIMEFALDNTFVKGVEGGILRQIFGIPMGDPHSPGMTILTCAWMESEWLSSLGPEAKGKFRAKRYMDDLICFFIKNNGIMTSSWKTSPGQNATWLPSSW